MLTNSLLLQYIQKKGIVKSSDLTKEFGVSRQYIGRLLHRLIKNYSVTKIGSTKSSEYTTPQYLEKNPIQHSLYYSKTFQNVQLEEHVVLDEIEQNFLPFSSLKENIKSIFEYAISEMLNNAIEHSLSQKIKITVYIQKDVVSFIVDDFGIGVYRSIKEKRKLASEMEAIQDLLKGKLTTSPKLHSGEGIFFTSKVGSEFILESYGYKYTSNTSIPDIFVEKSKGQKQGTRVTFHLNIHSTHHLNDVFKEYTNIGENSDYGFDKTEIHIRLYTTGGINISRSQARRVLAGLDKFLIIVLDYDRVPTVGQAFTDEIYRIFQQKYPTIRIENINMNEAVKFMVDRTKNEVKNMQLKK